MQSTVASSPEVYSSKNPSPKALAAWAAQKREETGVIEIERPLDDPAWNWGADNHNVVVSIENARRRAAAAAFELPKDRPAPPPMISLITVTDETRLFADSALEDVRAELESPDADPRESWLFIAVELASAELFSTGGICVSDADDEPLPAQAAILDKFATDHKDNWPGQEKHGGLFAWYDARQILRQEKRALLRRERAAQAAEKARREEEAGRKWIRAPYKVKNGIIYKKGTNDAPDRPLCQVFSVIGRSSNLAGDAGAGRIIEFENENRVTVEMTLDRADLFKADGGGALDALADAGMDLRYSGKSGRGEMLDMLRTIKRDRQIPVAPHPGWAHDRAGRATGFLAPTGEFIPAEADAPAMRLHSSATVKDKLPGGSLEGWQEGANAAHHNFHWTLGLCAGFAGPLLDLSGGLPCGFNLSGDSSLGKTMALTLGATIWAPAVSGKGVFHVMNSTMNALEDLFVTGSGTLTALDEIGALQNPATLAPMLFGASSGSGKARKAGRGAGLAETAEFRTFALMTNEHGLKDTITGAGGTYKTGLSVRFPDIDVTAAKKVPADVLAKLDKVKENFGHAGPAFVRYLIGEGWHNRAEELKARIKATAAEITGKDAAPALRRAAEVFALVQVAGELAADAGLIEKGPIKGAVKTAFDTFRQSDEGRATTGGDSLLDGLRSWVVRNIGRTLVNAEEAADASYREARGWVTDTLIILDYERLADLKGMGLNGKRDSLLAALAKAGALEMSGKNRIHNALPAEVNLDGGAAEKLVRNVRVRRDVLGV